MDSNFEKMKYLQKLKDKYRKKNYKNVEDKVVNNIHINDYFIFPKNWNMIIDIDKQILLLEKSLNENIPIDDLPEMEIVDRLVLIDKIQKMEYDVYERRNKIT